MISRWKRIGIMGGLGPLASAYFYLRLVEMSGAGSDQDHPEVIMISDPAIPDRIGHLMRGGETPVPRLASVAERLERAGAELIAMPSVTTQAYLAEVAPAVTVPLVDMLAATAGSLASAGIKSPAVAVTSATRIMGHLHSHLAAAGIEPVYPDEASQNDIQATVELVKSGGTAEAAARLPDILARPWAESSDGVLVGCTDLSPLAHGDRTGWCDVSSIYASAVLDLAAHP